MEQGTYPGSYQSSFEERNIMLHVYRFFAALKRRWWVLLLTTSLSLAVMGVRVSMEPPPLYVSTGRMWLSGKLNIREGNLFNESGNYLGTQMELMKSPQIQNNAHAALREERKELQPCAVNISVSQIPWASIFVLRATGSNPEYVQAFLDRCMAEYLKYKQRVRDQSSNRTQLSIMEQLNKLERDLKTQQTRLEDFQKANNLVVLQELNVGSGNYLTQLKQKMAELKMQSDLLQLFSLDENLDRALEQIRSGQVAVESPAAEGGNKGNSSFNSALTTEAYYTMRREIANLKAQMVDWGKTHKPKHPKMIGFQEEIDARERTLELFLTQSRERIDSKRHSLDLEMRNLQNTINEWEAKTLDASSKLAAYQNIQQEITRISKLYDHLLSLIQTVDVDKNLDQDDMAILDNASPASADRKQKAIAIVLAGGAGMFGGMVIVFLIVWFDDRVSSMGELKKQLQEMVLGQVPELDVRTTGKEVPDVGLLQEDDERHNFAESYRNIRSSILYMAYEGVRPKTMLVTSAVPNDGKTTVSMNLARAMAFGGSKVLLIEGDLRKGRIDKILGTPRTPGLVEALKGEVSPLEAIHPTDVPSLSFVPGGGSIHNPGEMYLGSAMDRFIRAVYDDFDYILMDSAPVLATDDTTSLAPKMDGVIFVVRGNFTSVRLAKQSLDLLYHRQVRILGLIYNRAVIRAPDYYYYKYAEYYKSSTQREKDAGGGKKSKAGSKA